MSSAVKVKICGLSDPADVAHAVTAGADYVGFVYFRKSPRFVAKEKVAELVAAAGGATSVALLVNPEDGEIEDALDDARFGMLQLHGEEPPERVRQIRKKYAIPVMKAVGIRDETDIRLIDGYSDAADQLLVDTKAPPGASRPGGIGTRFDWSLISGRDWNLPWMLAGGLDAGNVADAVRATGARQVDVSTGVESSPGRKDRSRIAEFIYAAKGR